MHELFFVVLTHYTVLTLKEKFILNNLLWYIACRHVNKINIVVHVSFND